MNDLIATCLVVVWLATGCVIAGFFWEVVMNGVPAWFARRTAPEDRADMEMVAGLTKLATEMDGRARLLVVLILLLLLTGWPFLILYSAVTGKK